MKDVEQERSRFQSIDDGQFGMLGGMSAVITPEFEAFARQQVEAGAFASEQEAVDAALNGYLADFHELRASIQEGIAEEEAGGGVDGETFMAEFLAETKARAATRAG